MERLRRENRRPLLVLHSCCAPCSSACLERLDEYFQMVVFYYNPNISPESEFRHRAEEQQRLIREMPLREDVQSVVGEYEPEAFYQRVKGHEADSEGGERCGICFEMRLRKTAEYAKRIGAEYFTTTLSISPLKDARRLNTLGAALAAEYGLKYLFSDFKKRDGYRRSCALSEQYRLYRQDFCGCVFSKREREQQQERQAFSVQEILKRKGEGKIGMQIEFHSEIGSTNVRAKELAVNGAAHGFAVLAERQQAGKGRFDRHFYSPEGCGVYISLILRPEWPAERASLLTPLAAVAVARAIERVCDLKPQIKWVNDVYVNQKKVCGVLCEAGFEPQSGKMQYVVMGIGVNVGQMRFPEELSEVATSLSNECGQRLSRAEFTAVLFDEINALWAQMDAAGFMAEYRSRSCVLGRKVSVFRGNERYEARAVDIDGEGSLIIQLPGGEKKTLHSGEISVRLNEAQ